MANPSFRLLWAGAALASVSEQLFVVCLTLLVLDLAGPGATLGLVLAVAAVPRAVLLPFGGVLADRVDAAKIVVASIWARTAVLAVLAALVVLGPPPILVIAGLAGLLGVLDAVYYPASLALLPRVVGPAELPRANAFVQGAESAGDLFGPAVAAGIVVVAGLGGGLSTVAWLYLLAAVALAAFARRFARTVPVRTQVRSAAPVPGRHALREGVRYAWGEPVVRTILLVLAVLNVAVVGPVLVGGAVLAEQRLGGTATLGLVFAGFGAGSLLGLLAAGARPPTRRGLVIVAGTALIGVGTALFGFVGALLPAVAVAAVVGVSAAYLGVVLVSWLQERVPEELRGRVMSLVALSVVASDPLSFALAGVLLPAGTTTLFVVCGGAVVLTAGAAAAASHAVRSLR